MPCIHRNNYQFLIDPVIGRVLNAQAFRSFQGWVDKVQRMDERTVLTEDNGPYQSQDGP